MNQTLEKIYVLERLLTNATVAGNTDLSNKIIVQLNNLVDELTRPVNTLTTRAYDEAPRTATTWATEASGGGTQAYTGTIRTTTGGF